MESKNMQRIYKVIMLIVIIVIITSLLTAFTTYQYLKNNGIYSDKIGTTSLDGLEYTLAQFRSELEKTYIGEINDEEMIEGAIKGYVDALGDPYTTYYTKEEMEKILEETNGNFVGIGIYMTEYPAENAILVIKPIENSPAEKAGILAGDLIIKVDDVECDGSKLEEASNRIRGEEGTTVKLEIKRNGETKIFEITRKTVTISHVSTEILDNDIGYISISDFEGNCSEEFKTKYKELEKSGIKKLIVDIRNNGGGIVDEALEISNMFIEKGSTLLITKDKSGEEEITKAENNSIINIPTVLLVNEYSASASEILAGSLKDYQKATIVGTKTYGKGIIQALHQLSDGSGLKVTISEYYTPNHNAIHKIGITPDVEVKLTNDTDTQLEKAIEILK